MCCRGIHINLAWVASPPPANSAADRIILLLMVRLPILSRQTRQGVEFVCGFGRKNL
jgi:hypothetical protein